MYTIIATDKSGIQFSIDLDTASLDELERVETGSLNHAHKLKYFARRDDLHKKKRRRIVRRHYRRMKEIFNRLRERCPNEDDVVVQELTDQANAVTAILNRWDTKAGSGKGKGFSEFELVQELQTPLRTLKQNLVLFDMELDDTHRKEMLKRQKQVGDALARAEAGIRAWIGGASIKYRGSLATGWRNAKKSVEGKAQRIDVMSFDADAFVEVPSTVWERWADLEIVTEREREGKMDLGELIVRARAVPKSLKDQLRKDLDEIDLYRRYRVRDGDTSRKAYIEQRIQINQPNVEAFSRLLNQLLGVQTVQEQLRLAMASVTGYKKKGAEADFSFVLQSEKKSLREMKSGNLYPLNEVASAGLPLTESDLELEFEDQTIKVRMPEKHVSMSQQVAQRTYEWETPTPTYTSQRPTEAMLIESYLGPNPGETLEKFAEKGQEKREAAAEAVERFRVLPFFQ